MSSHGHLAAMSAVLRYRYCTSHAADFSLRKKLREFRNLSDNGTFRT